MGTAREIPFLESEAGQHRAGQRHVLRLAAVGGTRQRQFIGAPMQLPELPPLDHGKHLKRLGTRPPPRGERGIPRRDVHVSIPIHDGGMHAMSGLHQLATRGDDIKRERDVWGAERRGGH